MCRPAVGESACWTDGDVWRTALVNRLRAARSWPVVTLVAPPGFGKTTLLEQWMARDDRAFVWLAPDGSDAEDADLRIHDALRDRGSEPLVIVADDAHLFGEAALGRIAAAARKAGDGTTLVLSGRSEPRLLDPSLPLLRSHGALFELGFLDLALTRREMKNVFRAHGRRPSDAELGELAEQTEGWPAAVDAAASSRGHERLQAMCFAELTLQQRSFLRRTSVLDQLSSSVCNAVLGGACRGIELDSLGTFFVPLDHRRQWYRHRRLFRDDLRSELEQIEPELVPVLHERAAAWYRANGALDSAIDHAHAAGDIVGSMDIFTQTALRAHNDGNDTAVESWLARVDASRGLRRFPGAAAVAARLHAHRGRTADAARCLAVARRGISDARSPAETSIVCARIALVDAAMGRKRPRAMLVGVRSALDRLGASDPWRPYGLLLKGVAQTLIGESDQADITFSRAVRSAERLHSTETRSLALTERALLADTRGDHECGEAFLARVDSPEEVGSFASHTLTLAVSAKMHLRHGRWKAARRSLEQAQLLLPRLTDALPWLTVQTTLELAAVYLMLRDSGPAQELLAEADRLLGPRPELAQLSAKRSELQHELEAIPAVDRCLTVGLTRAELRLLPWLASHLSFTEIGTEFHLSRHTIKTQAISTYRKLGVSSRSQAVSRATALGLIENGPAG